MSFTVPLPPRTQLYNRSCSNKHTHTINTHMGLKGKVGLVAAKASALRINLNIQGCSVVAPPLHAPSRAKHTRSLVCYLSHSPSPPPPSFTQSHYPQRSLVRDGKVRLFHAGLASSSLVAHVLHYPPPHANSFVIGPAVIKHTFEYQTNHR